jgi:hypothetical protein
MPEDSYLKLQAVVHQVAIDRYADTYANIDRYRYGQIIGISVLDRISELDKMKFKYL